MSRALLAIALLGLVAAATAYDISRVRTTTPEGWVRMARADPRQILNFRIALKQRNVDVLEVCICSTDLFLVKKVAFSDFGSSVPNAH
jgi:hypothetical protein